LTVVVVALVDSSAFDAVVVDVDAVVDY